MLSKAYLIKKGCLFIFFIPYINLLSTQLKAMDRVLRPERFDVIPSAQDAAKRWLHWLMTFENFVAAIPSAPDARVNKLHVLVNYVTSDVYQLFCEAETYEEAITE